MRQHDQSQMYWMRIKFVLSSSVFHVATTCWLLIFSRLISMILWYVEREFKRKIKIIRNKYKRTIIWQMRDETCLWIWIEILIFIEYNSVHNRYNDEFQVWRQKSLLSSISFVVLSICIIIDSFVRLENSCYLSSLTKRLLMKEIFNMTNKHEILKEIDSLNDATNKHEISEKIDSLNDATDKHELSEKIDSLNDVTNKHENCIIEIVSRLFSVVAQVHST
jgi:hypothetical protein